MDARFPPSKSIRLPIYAEFLSISVCGAAETTPATIGSTYSRSVPCSSSPGSFRQVDSDGKAGARGAVETRARGGTRNCRLGVGSSAAAREEVPPVSDGDIVHSQAALLVEDAAPAAAASTYPLDSLVPVQLTDAARDEALPGLSGERAQGLPPASSTSDPTVMPSLSSIGPSRSKSMGSGISCIRR